VPVIRYGCTVLRIALNVVLARKFVAWNVAAVVKPPKYAAGDRREIRPLTPEEAQRLLAALEGRCNSALVTAGFAVGLCPGEIVGLKEEDLDLEVATLSVRRQLHAISGKTIDPETASRRQRLERVELKTAKSRRTVPLPAVTVAAF
jgi:integrase